MAPQVLSNMFVPAFPNTGAGRWGRCRYGAEGPNVCRAWAIVHQWTRGRARTFTTPTDVMQIRFIFQPHLPFKNSGQPEWYMYNKTEAVFIICSTVIIKKHPPPYYLRYHTCKKLSLFRDSQPPFMCDHTLRQEPTETRVLLCGPKGSWKSWFWNQVWWLLICCYSSCWNVHWVISFKDRKKSTNS